MAAKYIWWKPPEEAVLWVERLCAQVMTLGEYEDIQDLDRLIGEASLCHVIDAAEAGWFNMRSWVYWHRRLALSPPGFSNEGVPALPVRKFR